MVNELIAIVMAGGFAKRLWPLTKNKSKPLLEVGGKKIVEHVLEKIEEVEGIDRVIITTNEKFEKEFEEFLSSYSGKKKTKLFVEPGLKNDQKMGALGGLEFLLEEKGIEEDVMVVAGDNLFGFSLEEIAGFYREKQAPVIAFHNVGNKELARKYGIAELDDEGKVVGFEEKPEEPKSTLASTGCYVFPKESLGLLHEYLEDNHPDALGFFISWLYKKTDVYGKAFEEEWFDIGSHEQLEKARTVYAKD